MGSAYDHQVELVVGAVITNQDRVLLIKSPKWGDRWIFPGGHVEYGEGIFATAEREGKEETGLDVSAQYVINAGENIFSPDFHRPAHMMYFHVVCAAQHEQLVQGLAEVSEIRWFTISAALELNLFPSNRESLERLRDSVRIPFNEKGKYV